jgi:hypothetical protein
VSFLAPLFLSLAALAGVPLLVHLLRRRVTRRMDFPAVRFLLQANREQDRERVVRNRLLLLLRVLAVLALVAAVARPVARIGGSGHPPTALAIVIDQSGSTRAVLEGRPVFARLQDAALDAIGALTPEDRGWLVTSGGAVVAGDAATLRQAVAALGPEAGGGDLDGALRRAVALVHAGRPRTPVLLVLTDGQRAALPGAPAALPPGDVAVVVHAPASAPAVNRGVLEAEPEPARWVPSGRVRLAVTATDSTSWRVLLGARTLARGTAPPAAAGAPLRLEVAGLAADTGWLAGRVEVDADDFPVDDVRHFVVRAAPPPPVAVRRSAGPFVTAAIETLIDEGRLRRAAAGDRAPVVIANAVEASGGPALWLAPADPLELVAANRSLERAGIPWRFGAAVRDTAPVRFRDTAAGPEGWVARTRYRLSRVAGPGDSGRVVASVNGAPWLVTGAGYVLVGSPLLPAATNAPLRAGFVPWLRDVLVQQLGEEGLVVTAVPHEAVTLPLAVDAVVDEDGTAWGGAGVTFAAPGEPGVYWLRRADRRIGALVVNPPVEESDVERWGTTVWQEAWVGRRAELVPAAGDVTRTVFDRAGGRSILWPLLLVALLALVAEAFVARGGLAGREGSDAGPAPAPVPPRRGR